MTIKTLLYGVALGCPLALCACSPIPVESVKTVTVKQPVIVPVPSAYTEPVIVPPLPGDADNAALAGWALALRHALDEANARLKAIAGLGHD